MKINQIICLWGILLLSGCASIIEGTSESIIIQSNINDVEIVVQNKYGIPVYKGSTPTSVSLKKKAGFFSGETYSIFAHRKGYVDNALILDTGLSGWYWGNILFGGLIGMLIVDPLTGGMWKFDNDMVYLNMRKENP